METNKILTLSMTPHWRYYMQSFASAQQLLGRSVNAGLHIVSVAPTTQNIQRLVIRFKNTTVNHEFMCSKIAFDTRTGSVRASIDYDMPMLRDTKLSYKHMSQSYAHMINDNRNIGALFNAINNALIRATTDVNVGYLNIKHTCEVYFEIEAPQTEINMMSQMLRMPIRAK